MYGHCTVYNSPEFIQACIQENKEIIKRIETEIDQLRQIEILEKKVEILKHEIAILEKKCSY